MAEDAGSVFSEVRLRLDNLDHDIMTVAGKFDTMGKKILSGAERPSAILKKTLTELTNELGDMTSKFSALTKGDAKKYFQDLEKAIKEAEKAGDSEKLTILQGEKEQAQEIKETIKALERKKKAVEKAVVKEQVKEQVNKHDEEEARLATITKLQQNYEKELREINDLYKLGVIDAKERDSQIAAAQMKEIKGLETLKTEYNGLEKEQGKINARIKQQADSYKNLVTIQPAQ